MKAARAAKPTLDRFTTMGELSLNVRHILSRFMPLAAGLVVLAIVLLMFEHNVGSVAFALMGGGAVCALYIWSQRGIGLPLLPMLVLQQLAASGLPILTDHDVLHQYPESMVTAAGVEVLVFFLTLALSWHLALTAFRVGRAEAYTLTGIDREGMQGLSRLGFGLAGGATAYFVAGNLGLLDVVFAILPNGSYSALTAIVAAASTCGFFLLAMISGFGGLKPTGRTCFWVMLTLNCAISAAGLLLSSSAIFVASVVIGLFWSTGRFPWRFLLIAAVLISLLNSGKYEMRSRYWKIADDEPTMTPVELPALPNFYLEWFNCSLDAVGGSREPAGPVVVSSTEKKRDDQSLLERLNNLQNQLYVIEAVEVGHISTLDGATYTMIPALLVPRMLWPDKPRSHEGQVLLNVHFGRQLLESTYSTYVAWGLLAEAYGNFGPIKGAIIIGIVLGVFFAWAENFTCRKPLLSIEGFVSFAVFLGLANSYEMVASVMVTSIFQSLVPIVAACAPFVQRKTVVRPET